MAPQRPETEQPRQPGGSTVPAPPDPDLAALTIRVRALELQMQALGIQVPGLSIIPVDPPPAASLVADHPPDPPALPARPDTRAVPVPKQTLEDRLGAQIFSRIGIIALLVGTTWFLKWAVDHDLIGPTGRVLIGLASGAALILWSERFRGKGFAAFSYTLKAVGTGVLYLTLWASFQLFHLLPAPVALAAMILVTAWNAWMAWSQDAELLAAYALIGGYATPALLSSGGNHELFLFTYLAVIDFATVLLIRLKPWPRLLVPAIIATATYFAGWYLKFFAPTLAAGQDRLLPTLLFVAIFFALFAAASLKPHADAPSIPYGSILLDVAVPLANAAFVAPALYLVLDDSGHHALLPWAAVLLAAIYLFLTRLQRTPAATAVHLSLATVFLTIAIPLKASGRWITVGWLVEGAALLWASRRISTADTELGQAAAAKSLQLLSGLALALGFLSLISLPFWLFSQVPSAFFNARFATSIVGIAVFALSAVIARTSSSVFYRRTTLLSVLALNFIALQAGVTEIVTFWRTTVGPEQALQSDLSISAFLACYGAILLAVGFSRRSPFLRWQALILLVLTIGKVFLYDVSGLSQGYRVASFMGLGALLLGVSFAYQKNLVGMREVSPLPPADSRNENEDRS